jgi:hypothetical protein
MGLVALKDAPEAILRTVDGSGVDCSSRLVSGDEPRVGVLLPDCGTEISRDRGYVGGDAVPSVWVAGVLMPVWVDDAVPLLFLIFAGGLLTSRVPLCGRVRRGALSERSSSLSWLAVWLFHLVVRRSEARAVSSYILRD